MFSASPDAVVVTDRDGVVTLASPSIETLFGYRPDEVVGQKVEFLIPEGARAVHVKHRTSFASSPAPRPMGAGLRLEGRRKDGTILAIDVSLTPTVVGGELLVSAYVRDATERRRGEDLLRFVNDVSHQALGGADPADTLNLSCARARVLVSATDVWLAVPGGDTAGSTAGSSTATGSGDMVVAASDGLHAPGFLGATISADVSLATRAMRDEAAIVVDSLQTEDRALPEARAAGLGPAVYLPMLAEDGPVGALVAARPEGAAQFTGAEVAALQAFAAATAVVAALARARDSLEKMRMLSEQERIARDLHDSVIQRLFALGMHLQATERVAGAGPFAERVRGAVGTIDEVIREIRETIFDLNNPDKSLQDVRRRVREVVGAAVDQLDVAARVSFRGPVESALAEEVSTQLLAVLREALSNCVRHAKASNIDVVVAVAEGWVTLSVADDGVGISDGPTAGNGLANMASRAEQCRGTLALSRRSPSGTLLQWRASLGKERA